VPIHLLPPWCRPFCSARRCFSVLHQFVPAHRLELLLSPLRSEASRRACAAIPRGMTGVPSASGSMALKQCPKTRSNLSRLRSSLTRVVRDRVIENRRCPYSASFAFNRLHQREVFAQAEPAPAPAAIRGKKIDEHRLLPSKIESRPSVALLAAMQEGEAARNRWTSCSFLRKRAMQRRNELRGILGAQRLGRQLPRSSAA